MAECFFSCSLSSELADATNTSDTVIAFETTTNGHSAPNLEPEHGRKARKLQPRRRRAKTPEEVPEDDDPSYFPDSREAAPRIKARKRKRETRSSGDVDDQSVDTVRMGSSSGDDVCVSNLLRDESCLNQTMEDDDDDDDDMTLVHFCNEVKRRRKASVGKT